eukprot:TRINITY_DN1034_c0_g1_i1.p5 TRINITY_DN1034_c0_g1~~TRINITY_DN1034_c0_g1_i1.p5  ORF type:complete len:102 (+),score=20.76 TRINITY_DN1034_c0_g1_i1:230-535(+)
MRAQVHELAGAANLGRRPADASPTDSCSDCESEDATSADDEEHEHAEASTTDSRPPGTADLNFDFELPLDPVIEALPTKQLRRLLDVRGLRAPRGSSIGTA